MAADPAAARAAPPARPRPPIEPLLRAVAVPAGLVVLLALVLASGRLGHAATWRLALGDLPQLLTGSVGGWPVSGGFALNVLIGTAAMALGGVLGLPLVLASLSRAPALRLPARLVVGFFRNAPWLVLLFFTLYLLPFRMRVLGHGFEFSPALKAIAGLGLPAAANLAEIVRGAVQSIHAGQWESARSLGYTGGQIYRHVILPQALRRMLPGLVNLYALLVLGSSLASVVGVQEVLTTLRNLLATLDETAIVPFYGVVFALFFLFCFPISLAARWMERAMHGDAL